AREENEKIIRFFKNADVLIHDAQFNSAEFEKHLGWGHSSYEYSIEEARMAGVKKLIFFHHDPNRTDKQLADLENFYQEANPDIKICMAMEGRTIEA
ncbi:MAG: MBL fold metallo-hydrolase, partial [Treponema sp.]|nr:MBL fold metallo-hydrolase [Treponema sp.]